MLTNNTQLFERRRLAPIFHFHNLIGFYPQQGCQVSLGLLCASPKFFQTQTILFFLKHNFPLDNHTKRIYIKSILLVGVINLNPAIKELYYHETEQERLNFDSDPEYQEKMARALAELRAEELSPALFSLLDTANQISFTHGFRLGLSLIRWALRG